MQVIWYSQICNVCMCNVFFTHLHFSVFEITGSGEDIFTMFFVFCKKIRRDLENPLEGLFLLTI